MANETLLSTTKKTNPGSFRSLIKITLCSVTRKGSKTKNIFINL